MSIFSRVKSDISRQDIHLKYKGDYDRQFQYNADCIEALDEDLIEVRKKNVELKHQLSLVNIEINGCRKHNKVLDGTIEDMNKRLNELEVKFDSFVPKAESKKVKPDMFEPEKVKAKKS